MSSSVTADRSHSALQPTLVGSGNVPAASHADVSSTPGHQNQKFINPDKIERAYQMPQNQFIHPNMFATNPADIKQPAVKVSVAAVDDHFHIPKHEDAEDLSERAERLKPPLSQAERFAIIKHDNVDFAALWRLAGTVTNPHEIELLRNHKKSNDWVHDALRDVTGGEGSAHHAELAPALSRSAQPESESAKPRKLTRAEHERHIIKSRLKMTRIV